MKFVATVRLNRDDIEAGFPSLDFCREFGLAERAWTRGMVGGQEASAEVDEEFARKHFYNESATIDQIYASVYFNLDMLRKGELANHPDLPDVLRLSLTDDRIIEIFAKIAEEKKARRDALGTDGDGDDDPSDD